MNKIKKFDLFAFYQVCDLGRRKEGHYTFTDPYWEGRDLVSRDREELLHQHLKEHGVLLGEGKAHQVSALKEGQSYHDTPLRWQGGVSGTLRYRANIESGDRLDMTVQVWACEGRVWIVIIDWGSAVFLMDPEYTA